MTIRTSPRRRAVAGSPARHTAVLFAVSSAFAATASLLDIAHVPRWLGWLDVASAAALVIVTTRTVARYRRLVTDGDLVVAWRQSQRFLSIIPLMLALFFLAGDRVNWPVLVIGFAWRAWLLLYTWPSLVAASRHERVAASRHERDVNRAHPSGPATSDPVQAHIEVSATTPELTYCAGQ